MNHFVEQALIGEAVVLQWVGIVTAVIFSGTILLGIVFACVRIFRPWIRCLLLGGRVPLIEIVGLALRRADVDLIVDMYVMSIQAQAKIPMRKIEVAYQSGADVELVTRAFIEASKSGKEIDFEELVDADRSEQFTSLLKDRGLLN